MRLASFSPSSKRRPMKRLAEYTVFSGLVTACRLAIVPTKISPLSSQATTEGVRRAPSSLTMTLASLPSITATTLLVVPRSMPMILPMILVLLNVALDTREGPCSCSAAPLGKPREAVAHGGRERPDGREREQHNHRRPGVNGARRRKGGKGRRTDQPSGLDRGKRPASQASSRAWRSKEGAVPADFGLTGPMARLLSASLLGR